MGLAGMHPEDIKAGLRKQFGTVRAFEIDKGLPLKSVNDLLRGKKSARVREAVEQALKSHAPASG